MIKYKPGAPLGLRTPKQNIAAVLGIYKGYKLIRLLPDLKQAMPAKDFHEVALDIADVAGLKPCVQGIVNGLGP